MWLGHMKTATFWKFCMFFSCNIEKIKLTGKRFTGCLRPIRGPYGCNMQGELYKTKNYDWINIFNIQHVSEERNHFKTSCQHRYAAWVAGYFMNKYDHFNSFKGFTFSSPNQEIILIPFLEILLPWTLRKNVWIQTLHLLQAACDPSFWLLLFLLCILPTEAAQSSWRSDTKLRSDPCWQTWDLYLGPVAEPLNNRAT